MKSKTYLTRLTNVVRSLDRDEVKAAIGDSTNNNRTLTVGQVVRYLTTRRNKGKKVLGRRTEAVYGVLKNEIRFNRSIGIGSPNRTDAIDINEFLSELTTTVSYGADFDVQAVLKRA